MSTTSIYQCGSRRGRSTEICLRRKEYASAIQAEGYRIAPTHISSRKIYIYIFNNILLTTYILYLRGTYILFAAFVFIYCTSTSSKLLYFPAAQMSEYEGSYGQPNVLRSVLSAVARKGVGDHANLRKNNFKDFDWKEKLQVMIKRISESGIPDEISKRLILHRPPSAFSSLNEKNP